MLTIAFDDTGDTSDGRGPATVDGLARQVAAVHREAGLTATLASAGADPDHVERGPVVLRDPGLRFTGTVAVPVTVRRR